MFPTIVSAGQSRSLPIPHCGLAAQIVDALARFNAAPAPP